MELPPRARRIQLAGQFGGVIGGTTSACAENTENQHNQQGLCGNYLRVRGEYFFRPFPSILKKGTTSACAENTYLYCSAPAPKGNYLRVRGEYSETCTYLSMMMELPPRARRIPKQVWCPNSTRGTTSACAENTAGLNFSLGLLRNYLRVRGEYRRIRLLQTQMWELPPRARRIQHLQTCF